MRTYLSNPKNFTVLSILVLVAVLALEAVVVNEVAKLLPSTIDGSDSRPMLQSLIAFDGVLLGFAAVVFNSLMNREATFQRISYLFGAMFSTVILFLISVTTAFFGLASVSSSGSPTSSFVVPLGFMIYGTSVLFFTMYVHVARSKQAFM